MFHLHRNSHRKVHHFTITKDDLRNLSASDNPFLKDITTRQNYESHSRLSVLPIANVTITIAIAVMHLSSNVIDFPFAYKVRVFNKNQSRRQKCRSRRRRGYSQHRCDLLGGGGGSGGVLLRETFKIRASKSAFPAFWGKN